MPRRSRSEIRSARKAKRRSRRLGKRGASLHRLAIIECPGCLLCVGSSSIHLLASLVDDDGGQPEMGEAPVATPEPLNVGPVAPGSEHAQRT